MGHCSNKVTAEQGLKALVTAQIMQIRLAGLEVDQRSWSELSAHLLCLASEQDAFTNADGRKVVTKRLYELARDAFEEHQRGVDLYQVSSLEALMYGLKNGMFCTEQRRRIRCEEDELFQLSLHYATEGIEDIIFACLERWQDVKIEELTVPTEMQSN